MTKLQANLNVVMPALGRAARKAAGELASTSGEQRNAALHAAAASIRSNVDAILSANKVDMRAAEDNGLSGPMLDRLMLDRPRVEAMAGGLASISELPDPLGKVLADWDRPNGLNIQRVAVPLGVIGIIYESRPNVTADAAALCLKSGNAVILRGGSESFNSSNAIYQCIRDGLASAGVPEDTVQMVPTRDRDAVARVKTLRT